jgi:hypothetical protein
MYRVAKPAEYLYEPAVNATRTSDDFRVIGNIEDVASVTSSLMARGFSMFPKLVSARVAPGQLHSLRRFRGRRATI